MLIASPNSRSTYARSVGWRQEPSHSARTIHGFLGRIHKARLRLKTLTVAQVNDLLAKDVQGHGFAPQPLSGKHRFCEGSSVSGKPKVVSSGTGERNPGSACVPARRLAGRPVLGRCEAASGGDRRRSAHRHPRLCHVDALGGVWSSRRRSHGTALEDFDWKYEVLNVPHGKRKKPRTYPLCRPVGDGVLGYLCEVRPRTEYREVFLTRIAPIKPLEPCAVGEMVKKRLHALGLTLPHYGSHVLRHACATHLLSQGLTLKEIGDHLGHRSAETTRIYAKVDLTALRAVGDFGLEDLL